MSSHQRYGKRGERDSTEISQGVQDLLAIVTGRERGCWTIRWRSALNRISSLSPGAVRVVSAKAPMRLQSASCEPGSGYRRRWSPVMTTALSLDITNTPPKSNSITSEKKRSETSFLPVRSGIDGALCGTSRRPRDSAESSERVRAESSTATPESPPCSESAPCVAPSESFRRRL